MADAYSAGASFTDMLKSHIGDVLTAAQAVANPGAAISRLAAPVANAAGAAGADFLGGALGFGRPSVTVALPPATPAPAAKAAIKPVAAAPAAASTPAAKTPAVAAADPLGAFGKLSFRQLLTLSQASENLQQKGSVRTPTSTDAAGAALASIYQQQFKSTLDAAGKDPAKQQAAVDAFEKKMLPIALRGNTADEYLYGNQ